jgi:diguanylate cyclase (GGDEF)-like protein/PAS domain S-box-containing protein
MQNTSIGNRIALALALPIIALLFFSLWTLAGYHRIANDTHDLREMAEFAPAVSALIHELQQERGLSAGFLGSNDEAFAENLSPQNDKTDAKSSSFLDALKRVGTERFDIRQGHSLTAAQESLEQLPVWRRSVAARGMTAEEITDKYSRTIEELIASLKTLLLFSTSGELSNSINAYIQFIQAKELVGIERATGSMYFSAGSFDSTHYTRFLQQIDQQKLYLNQFRFFSTPEHIELLEQALSSPAAKEAARIEQLVSKSILRKLSGIVDAAQWFDTMTGKINQLKVVEDRLAADLTAHAMKTEQSARYAAGFVSLLTLFILTVTVLLAAAIARGIIYPIIRLSKTMRQLALQDETVDITDQQRGDEIGEMARATMVFRENIARIAQAEERARSEAFLRLHHKALSSISQGVLITDMNKHITFVNAAFQQITGYSEGEMLGRNPDFLYGPETDINALRELRSAVSAGHPEPRAILGYRKDGSPFWSEVSVTPVADSQGQPSHVVSVMRDITESRRIEQEMRIAATAFESLHGMMVTDAKGTILRVNKAFTEMTGYAPDEVIGKLPSMFKSGRHDDAFYADMWRQLRDSGAWFGEIWDRRKNGDIFPKWQSISAVRGADGEISHYVSAFSDISAHKEAEEQIRSLAFYDPLTSLPNRRLLLDRLQQAMTLSGRVGSYGALLFIDLDQFKMLNDTLGHNIGDLLLIQVANRLSDSLRAHDTAARLGGDEFVVMLEDLSETAEEATAQARIVGEKILTSLNRRYQLAEHPYHNTPSIGITLFKGEQTSLDDLLKQADLAMYQSKAAGRNTLRFFDPGMQPDQATH